MLTLNQVSAFTEDEARETIERILWPNGPVCAHRGAMENVARLQGQAHRPGVMRCNNCHEQSTVTVGTIFEDSYLPLRKWLMAFALLCEEGDFIASVAARARHSIISDGVAPRAPHPACDEQRPSGWIAQRNG
jgi:hypothetical protein